MDIGQALFEAVMTGKKVTLTGDEYRKAIAEINQGCKEIAKEREKQFPEYKPKLLNLKDIILD